MKELLQDWCRRAVVNVAIPGNVMHQQILGIVDGCAVAAVYTRGKKPFVEEATSSPGLVCVEAGIFSSCF